MPPRTPPSKVLESPLSPRPRAPSRIAFQFWEDVLSALDIVPEFKLRFAITERIFKNALDEHLVLVCDHARRGDKIYYIDHSNIPVVLQQLYDSFRLMGEACVSRQETGEWNLAQIEMPLDDPFGTGSRISSAETLSITLESPSRRRRSYESLYNE